MLLGLSPSGPRSLKTSGAKGDQINNRPFSISLLLLALYIDKKLIIIIDHLVSVIGLNFDFLSLNLVGFTLYGCFNIFLFWVGSIQVSS